MDGVVRSKRGQEWKNTEKQNYETETVDASRKRLQEQQAKEDNQLQEMDGCFGHAKVDEIKREVLQPHETLQEWTEPRNSLVGYLCGQQEERKNSSTHRGR